MRVMFVATKHVCGTTKMFSFLSQQMFGFSRQTRVMFVVTKKKYLSQQKSYLCELPPVMIKTVSEKTFR